MILFMYMNILLFEILYYSCFIKFSKNEGNFMRYLIMFSIITLIGIIINTNTLQSYLALIIMIMLGLKYFVKVKVSLFDIMIIFIMLLIKVLIEAPIYMIFYKTLSIFSMGLIYSFFKMLFIGINKKRLPKIYNKLNKLWRNNNFYIRYLFSTFMFVYTIISCIFIILYYI